MHANGQAVCVVAASCGVACFLNEVNKDNLVIEIDVKRIKKHDTTWVSRPWPKAITHTVRVSCFIFS